MWIDDFNWDHLNDSEYYHMTLDMRRKNKQVRFFNMYRMTMKQFDQLVELLMPELGKKSTNYREPLCPQERLIITLT